MRRPRLLAWLLICFVGVVLTVVAKDSNDNENDVRLRVSIRKNTLKGVPSCQHTFSQIELLNLHATEPIIIHSIQTAPEETVLIRSASGEDVGRTWEDDAIPQQLHVSRLPSGSLSLGPNQVAIVPVTFLPRYPDIDNGISNEYSEETRSPPALSSTNRIDLMDLVGDEVLEVIESRKHINLLDSDSVSKRRHNLDPSSLPKGDEFEVATTVVVDTSRGVLKLPVSATSVRENSYSIPDTIRFYHPEAAKGSESASLKEASPSIKPVASSSPPISDVQLLGTMNVRDDSNNRREKPRPIQPPRDCFDLYLSNPLPDRDLEISEVLISKPELMSVEFEPSRLLLAPDLVVLSTGPGQVIREWTEEGPMYLPADSDDNYIATVCTAPGGVTRDESSDIYLEEMSNWIDSGSPDKSLGFLQIRTDAETLFIGLERFDETSVKAQLQAHKSEAVSLDANSTVPSSSILLRSVPDRLSFHVVSSTNQRVFAKFGLQNKSPVPIRIMRVSIGLHTAADNSIADASKILGLDVSVQLKGNETFPAPTLDTFILGPAETTSDDAFIVSCAVNADSSAMKQAYDETFLFTGTILLRGTMDTNMRYHDWKQEMKQNPYRDFHLSLEIPFNVSVLNGRVEFRIDKSTHISPQLFSFMPWDDSGLAITGMFFPTTWFSGLDGSDTSGRTQQREGSVEIGHDLRILTNMAIPMTLESAVIEDTTGGQIRGNDSPCTRFNVSTSNSVRKPHANSDLEDLGLISLHYKSRYNGKENSREGGADQSAADNLYPTTCFLRSVTNPVDSGIHRVPLVVFPGQLDVTSPNSFFKNQTTTTVMGHSSAAVGFAQLLTWFRTSAVGKSFIEVLEEMSGERKYRNDSHMLFNYIRKLCYRSSKLDKSRLKPILLKFGAVEHSDIARAPLFLTNHNPIPIYVSIDVGEVEGMSIVLGREGSQGPGNDDMVDFLPKQSDRIKRADKRSLVVAGKYQGHPLDGLRQFLVSNDKAISFSSRFPYRDAISMSKAAVSRQPFLQPLYNHYSFVEFHRSLLPERRFSKSSPCNEEAHPSSYTSFERPDGASKQSSSLSRAYIVSADKMLSRPLSICAEVPDTGISVSKSQIMIPPGGVARFELRVRAPSQSFLDSDISQLLATGLVLSTSFGQVMPIFATFEALQGQLQVSQLETALPINVASDLTPLDRENMTVIAVPPGLSWETATIEGDVPSSNLPEFSYATGLYGSHALGVPLHLSSSFSREVRLVNVESCNPWFNVALKNQPSRIGRDPTVAVDVGSLLCSIACESVASDTPPSYYQCALNWLNNKSELQPPSCGVAPLLQKRTNDDKGGTDASHGGMGRVITAFENAIEQLNDMYDSVDAIAMAAANKTAYASFLTRSRSPIGVKSGRVRSDGFIPITVLETFAEAWDAWRVASEFGLNTLSSTLRATIEYDIVTQFGADEQNDGVGTQSLSLSMHNLAVESVLTAPQLFDAASQRIASLSSERSLLQGDEPSVLHFPPTLVGKVTSLTIPLRNPTAIPIRVRIGAAPPGFIANDDAEKECAECSVDETIRNRYFRNHASPYIQNGQATIIQNESAQHLWWDGGGAFFLLDNRGDVIRSHHNITIRAGAGAHVSLVNPSLHASVAFIIGCGARCGVRDEAQPQKSNEKHVDPKLTSPIGAAAAAGITLAGKKRWNLPQVNAMGSDEPFIHAGGAPLPGSGGPSAFAVPYSALDEIVIPPFGVGEIGPILFRPPGRYSVLGCDTTKESGANHWGVQTAELCDSQNFESMIFLENSLTGLERLTVRGESMWENLYFTDPPPEEGNDAYGDIESYNGWATLFFDGSATSSKTSVWKEVHLRNGGDTIIDVSVVYLADTSRVLEKRWPTVGVSSSACSSGSLRLLNCWENDRSNIVSKGQIDNVRAGFRIEPGESRSLFIEHAADCTKQEEFVSLNVEYSSVSEGSNHFPRFSPSRYGKMKYNEANSRRALLTKKAHLMIGYHMDDSELARCTPVKMGSEINLPLGSPSGVVSEEESQRRVASTKGTSMFRSALRNLVYFVMIVATIILTVFIFERRSLAMSAAWPKLSQIITKLRPSSQAKPKKKGQLSIWNAAFRCLARADPTSAELQVLGKEQIRQVMIGRYRSRGQLPPPSLSSTGLISRERVGIPQANTPRQRSGKEGGVSNNERFRTLSDAIFLSSASDDHESTRHFLPAGLGWRTAYSRGIIDEKSIDRVSIDLESKKLLAARSAMAPSPVPELHTEDERKPSNIPVEEKVVKEAPTVVKNENNIGTTESIDMQSSGAEGPFVMVGDGSKSKPKQGPLSPTKRSMPVKISPRNADNSKNDVSKPNRSNDQKKGKTSKAVGAEAKPQIAKRNGHQVAAKGSTPAVAPIRREAVSDSGSEASSTKRDQRNTKNTNRDKGKQSNNQKGNQNQSGVPSENSKSAGDSNSLTRKKKGGKSEKGKSGAKDRSNTAQNEKQGKKAPSKSVKASSSKTPEGRGKSSRGSGPKPQMAAGKNPPAQPQEPLSMPLRPPPGLAPPPGFGGEAVADVRPTPVELPLPLGGTGGQPDLGPMLTAALSSTDLPLTGNSTSLPPLPFSQAAAGRSNLLFTGNIADSLPDTSNNPMSETHMPSGHSNVSPMMPPQFQQTLPPVQIEDPNSNSDGFDVMDFLDSILNDGGAGDQSERGQNPGLFPETTETPGLPLLSNPWATEASEGKSSRAAAYGISFDDTDDMSSDGSPVDVRATTPNTDDGLAAANIPLLTPAAIWNSGQDDDGDDAALAYSLVTAQEDLE